MSKAKKSIEQLLKLALKFGDGSSDRMYSRCYDAVDEIAAAARSKKHRPEVIAALQTIMEKGATPLPASAASWLHPLVSPENSELIPWFSERLKSEEIAYGCMCALLAIQGPAAFPKAAEVILDDSRSLNTRASVIQHLASKFHMPFDKSLPTQFPNCKREHIPVEDIRKWVAMGCPEQFEEPTVIPKKELIKLGVHLPNAYLKFLSSHGGRTEYYRDDTTWRLLAGDKLIEPVSVDGNKTPALFQLQSFAGTLREALEDDETEDAQGNPYPLDRLSGGWTIGSDVSGDVLYLDPTDGHSVWVYHHDGGDVERVAKTFQAWWKKARESG